MAEKYKYIITVDGKEHRVSKNNVDKYGWSGYADGYPKGTVRMRDTDGADYDVPLGDVDEMTDAGLHPFLMLELDKESQSAHNTQMPTPSISTIDDDPIVKASTTTEHVPQGYHDEDGIFHPYPISNTAADTATSPVPQAPTSNESQKNWQPSPMQKAAMIAEIHSGVDKTIGNMQGRVDKVRRLVESNTEEGRNKRKAAEMQARMVGATVRVPGLTGGTDSSASGDMSPNPGNPNSPIPYGVKMENGEAKTEWLLPDGTLSTSLIDADKAEFGARKARLQHEFVKRMEENGLDPAKKSDIEKQLEREFDDRLSALWQRHDPAEGESAAAQAWSAAEARQSAASDRNASRNWGRYNAMGGGREMGMVTAAMNMHDDQVAHMSNFDLNRLMDDAWDNLHEDGQKGLIDDCLQMLRHRNPGADELLLYNHAKKLARQQSDLRLYNIAVEKNRPKGELDYLLRKVGDMNLLRNISTGLAVSQANSTGDMAAYEAANEQYRQDGHRILDVAGTVTGFALDPTTWLSAGVGSAAARGAMWAGGRYMAGRGATAAVTNAATRQFATSMTGRVVGGIAGGAANFGTFEGVKEMEGQFAHGGHIVGQDETGRYVNEGYSASAVGSQALHGLVMGGAIGWLTPVSGNVSDKLVRGMSNTAAKVGTRAGVYAGATIAEGTIFSVPEWMEGKRDGFDVWTDNMAMMAGFKAKHMLKSAGGVLGDLKASFDSPANGRKNRMDFESRLRQRMDSPSDGGLSLTKDEKAELRRYGYDLRGLVESAERTGNAKEGNLIAQSAPKIVSRLTDMVNDPRISEAARAKMYYYATGRKLPMSTVMRGELIEDGENGFIVESQGANGVITSRSFKNRKAADLELERIRRQAELNLVELGERYQQTADFENRLQDACRSVAAENGWDMVEVYRTCEEARRNHLRGGDKQFDEAQQNILRKVTEAMGEFEETGVTDAMRGRINERHGVDIDNAIRKEANRRTQAEQTAIDEYIGELIPREAKANPVEDVKAEEWNNGRHLTDGEKPLDEEIRDNTAADRSTDTPDDMPDYGGAQPEMGQRPLGRAVMEYKDRQVEVLGGRVVMTDDGTMVDNGRSDRSIVIRDVETGKVEMVSPEAILSYEDYAPENPAAPVGNASDPDVADMPVESKYTSGYIEFRNPDGTEGRGRLSGYIDEDGKHEYYVAGDLKRLHYATEQELDDMLTVFKPDEPQQPIENIESQQESAEGPQGEVAMPTGVSAVGTVTVPQRDGSTRTFTVGKNNDGGNVVIDERGFMWAHDGNGDTLLPYSPGANVPIWSDEQLSKLGALKPLSEQPTDVPEMPETVPNIAENAENITENGENITENVPKTENPVENVQQSALSRIPMDDNGGYRFDAVDPETAWDGMVEFMENEDDASEYAAAMVGESEAAVKKAEQAITKVKPTNDPAKFKADKAAARSALSEAQRQMEHWQNVVGVASSRRAAIEEAARQQAEAERAAQIAAEARREAELQAEARRKAEEDAAAPREYAKAYAGWEQPATFEEYVLRRLSAGGMKLKWGKNERTGTNGLGAMLGYGSGTREQQGLLWLLDNANGYYPEEAAERMLVDFKAETGMEPNIDAMDAHNTLLDVIATHGSSRAMWTEAKRRHDAMEATAPVDEEYERQREWYETRFGMSPEEYEAYEEQVYSDIATREISDDEMSDFIATFADAILTEQKEREEYERNREHDNSAAGSLRERGDGILPEERPDIAAGDNPLVQRHQEADGNGNRPNGGTPQEKLSKEDAADIIAKMEMSAVDDPRIALSPESWLQSFGLNNSIETPMGKVKMGDGQYQKFVDKKRSNEFGMVVQTLQDPDIVFIEPSEAKEGQIAERNFSYVFVKTFIRDGKKLKYYTSVSVLKDGMEVSVSSHIANKTAILKKLESLERAYTKESLLPNSSEWHLAEHPTDVPDLLPTQGKSETTDVPTLTDANHLVTPISDLSGVSEDKNTESSAEKQAEPAESSMNERIAAAEAEVNTSPTDAQKAAGNYKKGHVQVGTFDVTIENPAGSVRSGVDADGKPWSNTMHNTYGYIRGTVGVDGDHIDVYLSSDIDGWNGRRVFVMDVYNPDGTFDEHKVMLGFNEKEDAAFDFAANYDMDWVKARRIEIHSLPLDNFEKWIESSKRKTKPFGEYAIAKKSDENNSNYSQSEAAQPVPPEKAANKPVNPSGNRLVSDERYAEIRERMRKKIGGQFNMGVDPEILALGTEMAVYHIERGARKFAAYASAMIADLGDTIRPYLKSFYNAVRDMPEAEATGIIADMDSYDDVRRVDIANFDKPNTDALATAAAIVVEQEADSQRVAAEKKLKEKRKTQSKAESKSTTDGGLFDNLPDNSLSSQAESTLIHNTNERTNVQSRPETTERGRQQPRPDEPLGKGAEHEDERTHGRGVARRGGEHPVSDPGRSTGVSRLSEGAERISDNAPRNSRNNHAERGAEYAPKGEKARIDANIAAIELAKRLLESGTPATPEDMAVLRRYSGWGGLGSAFNEGSTGSPNPANKRLHELLTPEEYDAAVMSRNSAYYTPAPVIDAMWDIAKALGFKGGNIMEGSAGIGNIIGLMPTDISERSSVHAVEVEPLTGGILSLLYPDAKVEVQGFEQTRIANGSVDLTITNVPFVPGLHVSDESGDSDLSRKFRDIHDFCIAKNVRKLREGGIGIFITTRTTLDDSQKLRNWLVGDKEGCADVVGVFRMHNKTFGGTPATSDIIVVRKRVNGRRSDNAIDVSTRTLARTAPYEDENGKTKELPMLINRYFIEHPECMGGEMFFNFERGWDTFRPKSIGLFPMQGADQSKRMAAWVKSLSEKDWDKEQGIAASQAIENVNEALGENVKEGGMVLDSKGNLCVARMGRAVPLEINANKVKGRTKAQCFHDYSELKDALAEVLKYQTEHEDDAGLQRGLDRLNRAYDTFVERYGNLNRNSNIAWLRNDVDFSSIVALEKYSEKGDKDGKRIKSYGKTDIFSRRVVEKESEPSPKNVKDGIIASLYKFGRIDTEYLAGQLGKSQGDIKDEIVKSGLGFENPTNGQMEVSYEYLSGNVREKLRQARQTNEATPGAYDANIKALEAVVPMNIPAHLIEFTLGSSWVDPKLYERFVKERTDLDVRLTNAGGTWHMKEPYWTDEPKNKEMGIRSESLGILIPGHKLIEAAITNKTITVSRTHRNSDGSSETETDPSATAACAAKVDEIRQDFKDWARAQMQSDPDMSMRMEEIYNEKFNNSVPKAIPDDFIPAHFGGAATTIGGKSFHLRPHQAKAVIRATTQPVMLAHEVGTGKTYTLITTAMEMRRLGTARKPMIVVQNATVGQFVASAKALYPNAKVLTLEDADRNAEGRKAFYAKIKFNDWDMIVVPQSVFERIPDSIERQAQFIQDKIDEKLLVLEQMKEADPDGRSQIVRAAEREIERLNDEMSQLDNGSDDTNRKGNKDQKKAAVTRQNAAVKAREMLDRETDDVEDFDSMGIDAILVDEAHEYKHLGFATAMQRGVKGIDPSFSKKSQGVFLKAQSVLEKTGGKNVVFATGTPISNTAAEIWTFMRYLMPADVMKDYGIYYFDDFVRNFGNLQQMLEFATNGKYKENNRFAGYVNLPELVRIWSTVADTVLTREAGGVSDKIPQMEGDKAQDIFLPQTRALRGIMKYVKAQLDEYDKMSGKEKKENSHIPLVMYGIAKAAAVDARLVQADAEDDPHSKTNEAVRQTLRTLDETKDYLGTIAIFADNYQNKGTGFNLYEDIRRKLIANGVPEEQIVVMKSNMTVKKKLEIFDKVNAGEVRVIMGSTFTLGTGVNIQERLHTLIHLDAPNRPMDYTQRNGRILRQGNLHRDWNLPVRVLRFGVEDSLDVTAYQRLKTKGAIADSIMNGKQLMANSMDNRSLEEEQDLFGDITAQLSGSEYALLKNQIEKEVRKLTAKRKAWEADQTYIHNRKRQIAGLNKVAEKRIADNTAYVEKIEAANVGDITVGNLSFPGIEAMEDFFAEQNKKKRELQERMRKEVYSSSPATMDMTVSVGGFDFNIHTEITKEMKQGQGSLFASAPAKMTYSCPELGIESMPVKENLIKNALREIMDDVMSGKDFRDRIETAEQSIERNNAELKSMEARDGVPFQFSGELAKAEAKLEEYDTLMKKEMEEKEAKYAELDKGVEAASNIELTEEDSEEAASEPVASYSEESANFASEYETQDGKTIRYTSECGESYGGLFDFDFSGDEAVSRNDGRGEGESLHGNDSRTRADGLQRQGGSLLDNGTGLRGGLDTGYGEFSVVERVFTESGSFKFTSGERIKSADDVAFIFSALEDAAKEHSFAVFVKDGVPTVVELGMGTFTGTMVDMPTASLAYNRIRPDEIYFVHNHPSGNLVCSAQDVQMLRKFEEMSDVPVYGVIINLKTGKYGTFDTSNNTSVGEKRIPERELPLSVHTLDKQIFAPDYDPMAQPLVRGSADVAKFLNSQRMGDRGKVSFLILSRANRIVGNIHTPFTRISGNADDVARYISERIVQFGGESAILYGDFEISNADGSTYRKLKQKIESTGGHTQMGGPTLLDVVHVEGNHTRSAMDEGILREPDSEYGASPVVKYAQRLAKKFNTPIRIVSDIEELPNFLRSKKGFYDMATGEVVIVAPNNVGVEDVAATVFHEVVAHKGLREMIGEENYDVFCDEVYNHLKDDLKSGIDGETTRRFMDDPGRGYEYNRRVAVDEMFGRLSEKGFEDFTKAERGIWAKLKAKVLEAINKFLGTLKLPKWVMLGDNELRYMLWRSHERLRAKGDYVDMARDAAKRDELGLSKNDDTNKAALKHLEPVDVEHAAKVAKRIETAKAKLSEVAKAYRDTQNPKGFLSDLSKGLDLIVGTGGSGYRAFELKDGNTVVVRVSNHNVKARNAGDDRVISIVLKSKRSQNTFEPNPHKVVDEYVYLKEDISKAPAGTLSMIAECMIGLLDTGIYVDQTHLAKENHSPESINERYRFRDGETDDIWNDRSVGLEERITNAAIRMSSNQDSDLTLRNEAMKAIGDNLTSLRKAMAAQRLYDQSTVKRVADLARILLQNGYLSDMTSGEVQRLISAVKNSIGHVVTDKDTGEQRVVGGPKNQKAQVDNIMDIMIDNQLRNGEAALHKLESIRGSKVDARNLQVQGQLDPNGQAIIEAYRSAKSLSVGEIESQITNAIDRMSNPNAQIAENASLEYSGLNLAKQYAKTIAQSKTEEKAFRKEIKKAEEEKKAGQMTSDAFKQFKDATEETIRKLRVERAEAYAEMASRLAEELGESTSRAKQWREEQKERINRIHHLANSDMEGRELRGDRPDSRIRKTLNNPFVQFALAPLATFDQMLKMLGSKNPNGEGYLHDYFMRSFFDAADGEQEMKEKYQSQMDDKAQEILGKGKKYLDFYHYADTQKSAIVTYHDGADMREYEVPQSGLLYLYAVEKMPMGKATNRRMGITEEMMQHIDEALDPKLKEFVDWVQEEYLPELGADVDKVYVNVFGAHMDAIENYFPFVRDKDALKRDVEVGKEEHGDDRISLQSGFMKKRVPSVAKWDTLSELNFFDVLAKHVADATHMANYMEFNRDLGILLSYGRLKQQIMNMTSAYGGSKKLWTKFTKVCAIAADSYNPKKSNFDAAAVTIAKGVTMSKISGRPYTAAKQLLSLPAFAGEVDIRDLAKDIAMGGVPAMQWAWRNMPNFRKRILSRTMGDYRLMETEYDNKIMKAATYGMMPNMAVDAWTIALGSHGVYLKNKRKYLQWGMDEERAKRRAVQDAEMCYNKSQQSSEGAYMAQIQMDHTWLSTTAMLFRNSSTSYTRETHNSARNLKRIVSGEANAEFVAKQILRAVYPEQEGAWTDEQWIKARIEAKREMRNAVVKNSVNVAMFGWILPWLWRIGGIAPLLLLSGDEDEKRKKREEAMTQSMFAPMEGLAYGDVIVGGFNKVADWSQRWSLRENPIMSDIEQAYNNLDKDWVKGANDVFNIVFSSYTGINPQTVTDWAVAAMDYYDAKDKLTSKEIALLGARILNCPQSQTDAIFLEELDMSVAEARNMTPSEVANRYAAYKMRREAPLTGWMRSEEGRKAIHKDKEAKAIKIGKKYMKDHGDAAVNEAYIDFEERYNAVGKKKQEVEAMRKEAQDLMEVDYVEAEQAHDAANRAMEELRQDPDFGLYQLFGQHNPQLNHLSKMWLKSQSPEEAQLVANAIADYRAAMVKALQAADEEERQAALEELSMIMTVFNNRRKALRPKRRHEGAVSQ